jgi:cell volume regulation protein A
VLTFILEMLFIGVILHFILDMDFLLALTLGSIVGGTTEAVVIPLARRMRIHPRTKGMLIMESVITDVLVIVTTITLISLIQIGDFDIVSIGTDIAIKFTVGGVVGALAGTAWLFVLDRLHNQPLSYMITVAALFVIAGAVELPPVNSSGAVAALTFGLAIGNRQFVKRKLTSLSLASLSDDHIHHFQSEITFFVRTFFFVYLGLMFRFDTFSTTHLVAGLLVISIIVLVRRMTSALTWRVGDLETGDANAVFSMMPKGLSAAVLATLPAASLAGLAIWNDDLGILFLNVTLIVILGTTILATIFSFATERGIDKKQMMELRQRLRESE